MFLIYQDEYWTLKCHAGPRPTLESVKKTTWTLQSCYLDDFLLPLKEVWGAGQEQFWFRLEKYIFT